MSEPADEANKPGPMTRIEGEEVRLLVHIAPIDPAADGATAPHEGDERDAEDSPGLDE